MSQMWELPSLTIAVCKNLHPSAEHRSQHRVVLDERADGGVVKRSPDIELHVLGRVAFDHSFM